MERAALKRWILDTGCACEHQGAVFLVDPHWGASEREHAARAWARPTAPAPDGLGWLCIATGGTSGGIRYARHDEQTINAAVTGFCSHFGIQRVNALGVLPPHHVSGLMARLRCAATGGTHIDWTWKQLESGHWPDMPGDAADWVLSLVPTQLQRLLGQPGAVARLKRFRVVFLGGGPLWPELADRTAEAGIPVVASYGMTETAAMIAAQRPEDFRQGDRSCGSIMPHARVEIVDETTGGALPVGETGLIRISGESVFRGYWPEWSDERIFSPEDLGYLDTHGALHILGRRDAMIITGGKKVQPAEVEAALRASGQLGDVGVIGLPDAHWGEAVVACYPAAGGPPDPAGLDAALAALASYKRPKHFIPITDWPRNAQGKLNRAALAKAALEALGQGAGRRS